MSTIASFVTILFYVIICFFDLVSIVSSIFYWIDKEKKDAITAIYYSILLTLIIIFSFTAPHLLPIPTLPLIVWDAIDCYNSIKENNLKGSILAFVGTLFFATVLVLF